ncbi:LysR family transcriptional regulator [Rhizobium ruizarguesonis]|uniref:LysR family transcriptional regulator n=1 Tax=Rhizobium ruizarguesonis TaxID=2081791 RepID=UPI001FE1418E|nr:LysR family transcriptional regulator [Rhizobium ruizarguesonis]
MKLLRCFCTIVDEGSFTSAQATLNLSQSVLSDYLKTLEVRLGTTLCQRGPKGFKLFSEGQVVYEAAKELFASIETFKQKAWTINDNVHGELVIGVQDSVIDNPDAFIPEAIERFAEYHPNIRFRLEVMLGLQMPGKVADGLINVGIGMVTDQFEHLGFEPLFEETFVLCCSRKHPLANVPDHLITEEDIGETPFCNRGHLEGILPNPDMHYFRTPGDIGQGAHAKLALVLSGRNIGYVLRHVARHHIESGALRVIKPQLTYSAPINAVTKLNSPKFKLAQRFVDSLVDIHMEKSTTAMRAVAD